MGLLVGEQTLIVLILLCALSCELFASPEQHLTPCDLNGMH